jgi:RNA polymerase sigma factor (sigma-70 family)
MFFSRAFVQYTKELNNEKYNPLTKEEEKVLVLQLSSGSLEAKEHIINAHLRFVVYLLRDFKIPSQIDSMDLIQEGNLGLIDGLSRFDMTLNCRISTYVQYYIRWYMSRALGLYDKNTNIYELPENFNFDEIESDSTVEERVHQDILSFIKTFLDQRETKIISLLFGLEYPFKPLTLRESGSMLHLNSERVRQIKEEALEKIRQKQQTINLLR